MRAILAAGVAFSCFGAALAGPAPESLVAGLSDPSFRRREQCARELEALGEAALPALRAARDAGDPERARRSVLLVERIGRRLLAGRLLTAPRVDLDYADKPLADALDDFARLTGVHSRLASGQGDRRVSLKASNLPVWEAFDRLCRTGGVRERAAVPNPADATILLEDGNDDAPARRTDSVRVRVVPLPSLPGRAVSGERRFGLDVRVAQPLTCLEVVGVSLRGEDDRGRPATEAALAPAVQSSTEIADRLLAERAGVPAADELPASVQRVRVAIATPPPSTLRSVRGVVSLRVRVPDEVLLRVGPSPSGRREPLPDGSYFTLLGCAAAEDGAVVCRCRFDLAPTEEPAQLRRVAAFSRTPSGRRLPAVSLLDASGGRWRLAEADEAPADPDRPLRRELTLAFRKPDGAGAPAEVVLSGSFPFVLDVPFEFRDVSLSP